MQERYVPIYTAKEICALGAYGLAQLSFFAAPAMLGLTNLSIAAMAFSASLVYSVYNICKTQRRINDLNSSRFTFYLQQDNSLGTNLQERVNAISRFLRMEKIPEIHIENKSLCNAYAYANGKILITSNLLKKLDINEQNAVIGHETAHIAAKHSLINNVVLDTVYPIQIYSAFLVATNPISYTAAALPLITILSLSFLNTKMIHRSEYQADRIGADTTSPEHMISALKKLDDPDKKDKKSREITKENCKELSYLSLLQKVFYKVASTALRSHPDTSSRIERLEKQKENRKLAIC